MICPVCKELNQKSTVRDMGSSSTLLAWSPGHWDEDGNYVQHENPNRIITDFRCSNGHIFSQTKHRGDSYITIHKK